MEQAKQAFEAAIHQAHEDGHSNRAIAKEAGVSYESVRLLLRRSSKIDETARMQARLDELDQRWESFIDQLADAFTSPDLKREQLRRNTANGKAKRIHARCEKSSRRRGFVGVAPLDLIPTVKADGRRDAESYALRYLDENRSHPVVLRMLGEIDEAETLREALTAHRDAEVSFLHD